MTTAPSTIPASFSQSLKDSTWELHQKAENHVIQKSLVKGELPREGYAAFLGQMLLVHATLEQGLRTLRETRPELAHMLGDERFQEPRLRADIAALGGDPDAVEPVPATAAFCERIEALTHGDPSALIGIHYVTEGSTNGGRFIAKALRRAYGFEGDAAVSYYDPYGESQREKWASYKAGLDAMELTPAQRSLALDAAADTFRAISAIGDDLLAAQASA